jgi:cysteinyl-tRNA synthetase
MKPFEKSLCFVFSSVLVNKWPEKNMTDLQLYNSLVREKQVFKPIDPSHVKIYACGPTVYNYAHIGNARMAVVFDLLSRVLKTLYPRVTYVSNITDVDDKILAASKETGEAIDVITRKYEKIYNEDMAALGCSAPDIQPRATEHIAEMIALIEVLIARGHAYAADGHVLFHVPSFPEYGGLSGRSRDEQVAGARVEVASYKKDAADFVLWKPSEADEPGWDSPWGFGRPGWHIECSAMAEKHLGLPFDIHGGGADLKFPHHENEIAQSCCAHGAHNLDAFAKVWVHNGFLTVEGEKMSKSLGNFLLAHDLIEAHTGEALRLTLLSAHYRQPLDWSADKVQQSQKQLDKFYARLDEMADMEAAEDSVPAGVMEALCDDLNTPLAMAELSALLKSENSPALKGALIAAGDLLGILQHDPQEWLGFGGGEISDYDALLAERAEAKAAKNFARADEIRDELAAQGIEILDTPEGAKWRKI